MMHHSVMMKVEDGDPRMVAWNEFKEREHFKSIMNHIEGDLWAAFETGFMALLNHDIPSLEEAMALSVEQREKNMILAEKQLEWLDEAASVAKKAFDFWFDCYNKTEEKT